MDNKPKYQLLKEYIKNHIKNNDLHYNDLISSEIELMKQFGISRHTVRRGISDLVNEGWLYKQQGKGTYVSDPKANQSGHGKLVGVITTYINDYIFPEIIAGMEEAFSEEGYSIILGNTNNNVDKERLILTNMLNSNLSGLIVEPTKSVFPNHNKDLFEQISKRGIPILFIHATYQNVSANYIVEDDIMAGYEATKYLIDNGHTRIGGMFKQDDMQGHGRYEGYLKALRESDMTSNDHAVSWYTTETRDLIISENNEDGLNQLLKDVTGIVVYNDQAASELITVLDNIGINVPGDVSLVSFDNANIAVSGKVKLTTIAHPKAGLGMDAAKGLMQLMNNRIDKFEKVIIPELVVRESVRQL
jgi:GntR family transcriptional regulator of arabinose operon